MYYYRARYYDASIGRFIQEDPHPGKVENPITVVNKYAYAGNVPTLYTDPSGRIFGWDDLVYFFISSLVATAVQDAFHETGGKSFLETWASNFISVVFLATVGVFVFDSSWSGHFLDSGAMAAQVGLAQGTWMGLTNSAISFASHTLGIPFNDILPIAFMIMGPVDFSRAFDARRSFDPPRYNLRTPWRLPDD